MNRCETCKFWQRYDHSLHGECEHITNGDETLDFDEGGYFVKNTYDLLIVVEGSKTVTRAEFGCVMHRERPREA